MFILYIFFFFNDTATTEIYTLSLHDALPISATIRRWSRCRAATCSGWARGSSGRRSEEHTSELQSQSNLVCRLLLEKKKNPTHYRPTTAHNRSNSTTLSRDDTRQSVTTSRLR